MPYRTDHSAVTHAVAIACVLGMPVSAQADAVKLLVRHPAGKSHNTTSFHDRAEIQSSSEPMRAAKGVIIYPVPGGHVLMADGRQVPGVKAVRMHVGKTRRAVVQAHLESHIHTMDFETCETGYGPCVSPF